MFTKKLSYWAARNTSKARYVIAFCIVTLAALSLLIGITAAVTGNIFATPLYFALSLSIFGVLVVNYPQVKTAFDKNKPQVSFAKRKFFDAALAVVFSLFLIGFGNQATTHSISNNSTVNFISDNVLTTPTFQVLGASQVKKEKSKFLRLVDRAQNKVVSFFQKMSEKDNFDALMILAVFCIVLLYASLIIVLGFFACSLSCNGMGVLALILFVGGMAISLASAFFLFRAILNRQNKDRGEPWSQKKVNFRTFLATVATFFSPLLFLIFL